MRATEREAAEQRERRLEETLSQVRSHCVVSRWRFFVEGASRRQAADIEDGTWAQIRRASHHWRSGAQKNEREAGLTERQAEELQRLDTEAEEFRGQNRELLASLHQCQTELQISVMETQRLQEREEAYELDMLRMSGENAELAGHNNHKQKIRHLAAVKAENQSLRQDLQKSKQKQAQSERQLRTSSFFGEAVAEAPSTDGPASRIRTPGRARAPATPGKGGHITASIAATPRTSGQGMEAGVMVGEEAALRREKAEVARMARAHRRASERAASEYQHLVALVEQALDFQSSGTGASATKSAPGSRGTASIPATPDAQSAEVAAGGLEHRVLYRRLRELAGSLSSTSAAAGVAEVSTAPQTPRTTQGSAHKLQIETSPLIQQERPLDGAMVDGAQGGA